MYWMSIKGLYLPKALQVGLHAVEIKQAHAVVSRAGQHPGAAVVHIKRRHILPLTCMHYGLCQG